MERERDSAMAMERGSASHQSTAAAGPERKSNILSFDPQELVFDNVRLQEVTAACVCVYVCVCICVCVCVQQLAIALCRYTQRLLRFPTLSTPL